MSAFHQHKNDIISTTPIRLKKLEASTGSEMQHWRSDNAGENKSLQQQMISKKWQFKCKFEFMAAQTPQQNSRAETSFTFIAGKARAMQQAANLPLAMRYCLFPVTIVLATKLD